jgi:hypothetical protein
MTIHAAELIKDAESRRFVAGSRDGVLVRPNTPYTVVIQYHNRERVHIKCETLRQVRKEVLKHRSNRLVKYIHYNIQFDVNEVEKIDAYDARDPRRYV